jgi:hypothetical protein
MKELLNMSEPSEPGEQFLHKKNLISHTSPPVEHELERRKLAGEEVSQRPADKIAAWLGVIEKTHIGHKDDPRVLERIKQYYHREYVIRPENIPQSYWNLQGEIAVNEGRKQDLTSAGVLIEETTAYDQNGHEVKKRSYTFPEQVKEPAIRTVITNQQQSLDKWIDYLTSEDAKYPMWAKYWAFRSVVRMGKLEKTEDGKARFASRDPKKNTTVSSFPVLNQRALANTIGSMSARLEARAKPKGQQTTENLSATLSDDEYQKLLSTEDFSQLYAQFLAEIPEYSTHGLGETRGKWMKYDQGSDPTTLVKSLEGHPLEWCTADMDTAKTQLEAGDFYVYYSLDEEGNPNIPRVAIRMEDNHIAEIRGIAPNQNMDPFISGIVEERMQEFGQEGEVYKKKAADMKQLTTLEQKTLRAQPLSQEELIFLYELDAPIEGFGYEKDPRIGELRSQRNPDADMLVVLNCEESQIANRVSDINENTQAYVGPLEPGIFQRLPDHVRHIYTSFPEGRIRRESVTIGGKTKEQLQLEMQERGIQISLWTQDMLDSKDFTTLNQPEDRPLVRLNVGALGLKSQYPTTDEIYTRVQELGLDLCPAEVGPHYRLQYKNQPMNEWLYVGMKQIADRDGNPSVFRIVRGGSGVWLDDRWARPAREWHPKFEFVFSLRK